MLKSIFAIPNFIATNKTCLKELAEPNITKYPNFNAFFLCKLKPGAWPILNTDLCGACCEADCWLPVTYLSVKAAQKFWIKDNIFMLKVLLHYKLLTSNTLCTHLVIETPPYAFDLSVLRCMLTIFKLAPVDYH